MSGVHVGMPVFTPELLREVLGLYPTGITVVTAKFQGAPCGVTVNSFSSVSLDPPLVLFSLSRKLYTLQALLSAQAFAVHFLRSRVPSRTSGRTFHTATG